MAPKYLILDEPSAGLDPVGRREIFAQIRALHQEKGVTVILISHNMEDIAAMANRLLVLKQGNVILDGNPLDIFSSQRSLLQGAGVAVPPITELLHYLKHRGLAVGERVHTVEEGARLIYEAWKEKQHAH